MICACLITRLPTEMLSLRPTTLKPSRRGLTEDPLAKTLAGDERRPPAWWSANWPRPPGLANSKDKVTPRMGLLRFVIATP
jgi:hypothetical protein